MEYRMMEKAFTLILYFCFHSNHEQFMIGKLYTKELVTFEKNRVYLVDHMLCVFSFDCLSAD